MAQPTTLRFGAGAFYIGDGNSPEVFTKVCGFNSVNIDITKETNDVTVADCDNPDAAAWTERDVVALSWTMSFAGVMAVESLDLVEDATFTSLTRNVRLDLAGAGSGGGTPNRRYSGRGHIRMGLNSERGQKWQISVNVEGDGILTKSDIA